MSYSVTGVAAISFPVQALQSDAYSVPGSYRSITPHQGNRQFGADSAASASGAAAQSDQASGAVKASEPKPTAPAPVDTVTLSTSQKVLQLQREGESLLQIAATLNLPPKEVQSDLHLDAHVAQSFTVAPVTNPLTVDASATSSAATKVA